MSLFNFVCWLSIHMFSVPFEKAKGVVTKRQTNSGYFAQSPRERVCIASSKREGR